MSCLTATLRARGPAHARAPYLQDWGSTASAIDCCLSVADEHDIQVNLHADTLNEYGYVQDTIAAFKNRVVSSYHTEGAG